MHKKVIAILFIIFILLAGCQSDPIQDDLQHYSSEAMQSAYELENKAISAFRGVAGANYINDQMMHNALVNEVIPNYKELLKELKSVKIETAELREIHELFIEGATIQYDAFLVIVQALENQDPVLIEKANGMFEEASVLIREYRTKMEKLAEEHNVELGKP